MDDRMCPPPHPRFSTHVLGAGCTHGLCAVRVPCEQLELGPEVLRVTVPERTEQLVHLVLQPLTRGQHPLAALCTATGPTATACSMGK